MKNRSNLIILFGLLILSLFSCSTLQKDVEVYTTFEEKTPEIMEAEKELVFLEVENLLKPNSVTAEQADKIIKKIDNIIINWFKETSIYDDLKGVTIYGRNDNKELQKTKTKPSKKTDIKDSTTTV